MSRAALKGRIFSRDRRDRRDDDDRDDRRNDRRDDRHDDRSRGRRRERDDDDGDDRRDDRREDRSRGSDLGAALDRIASGIDGVREREREGMVDALGNLADRIESQRSRRPPVARRDDDDDDRRRDRSRGRRDDDDRDVRVIGDARDVLYRRFERGLDTDGREEIRAMRNPRMDALAADWARALSRGDVGEVDRIREEMDDRYSRQLGYSRAPLLEGTPDADSGFASGTGGELLPLPLAGQLIMERDKASKMRALVNVFPMATQTQRIPVLPTVTASSRAENASYTDNTPNPDSALLSAKDIGVEFSAGRNFLEDTPFNIANQLTVVAGGAIGAEEDVQICTSTANGGDITEGLDDATITDIAETTAGTLGYVDVVALYYGLPEQYRRNAKFFATSTTLQDVMSILDANGRPIFVSQFDAPRMINDLDGAAVGVLLGKPVFEVPVADDVLHFGDPQWYALGNRAGIRVDTDRAVSTGERTWVIDERIDGRVIPTSVVGTNNAWRKIVY